MRSFWLGISKNLPLVKRIPNDSCNLKSLDIYIYIYIYTYRLYIYIYISTPALYNIPLIPEECS